MTTWLTVWLLAVLVPVVIIKRFRNISFSHDKTKTADIKELTSKEELDKIATTLYKTFIDSNLGELIKSNVCYNGNIQLSDLMRANEKISNVTIKSLKSQADTLLVFTTCNYIQYSINALSRIVKSINNDKRFQLVVIDDHSIDGTANTLSKLGFAVIKNSHPSGLTFSWNIGYKLANLLNMSYIIFINNDVLIPHGSLQNLRYALISNSLITPMTTTVGAGIKRI
jgi:hypothetical protein